MPLVGRSRERAVITTALERASGGSGSVLVFGGEAGIGKSALVHALIERARALGFEVFMGAARSETVDLAFAPVVEAFDLATADDEDRAPIVAMLASTGSGSPLGVGLRSRLVEAITELVEGRARGGAVVVAIEDLQWADPSTLLVLERLGDLTTSHPCVLACTARSDPRAPVAEALENLGRRGYRLHLGGLDRPQVEELVEARFGAPADPKFVDMLGRAGGNPFFLTELMAAVEEHGMLAAGGPAELNPSGLPPSLTLTVLGRLRTFPEDTVRLLRAASVLGSQFAVEELRAMTSATGIELMGALEPALRAEVLVERPGRLAFHHDIVREALYDDIPPSLRMALHADAARSLEEAGAPAGVVAGHVRAGAAPGDEFAVARLRRAAEAALDRAPGVATDLLEHALSLAGPTPPQRYELRVVLARALVRVGRFEDAERLAREARAEQRGGSLDRDLLLTLARAAYWRGRSSELAGLLESASREPDASPVERAHLLAEAAAGAAQARQYERAQSLVEEALVQAQTTDDDTPHCRLLLVQASLHKSRSSLMLAIAAQRNALELIRSGAVAEDTAVSVFIELGDNLGHLSEHREEAVELLTAGLRRAEEAGMAWTGPMFHFALGVIRYREGAWDDAIVDLETGVRLGRQTAPGIAAQCSAGLGLIHARRGELSRAEGWIACAEDLASAEAVGPELTLARAFLAEAKGGPADALDTLIRPLSKVPRPRMAALSVNYGLHIARLAAGLNKLHVTDSVLEATLEAARRTPHPHVEALAAATSAIIRRDPDGALAAFEEIRSANAVVPSVADVAEQTALLLADDGRTAEAVRLLEESLAIWEKAGAIREVRRIEAELRELGVRRRRSRARASVGWEAVTPAEQAVLDLILDGLLYRRIADQLFISKRTVETHVMHLFQKLGVANRRELEELARERRPR